MRYSAFFSVLLVTALVCGLMLSCSKKKEAIPVVIFTNGEAQIERAGSEPRDIATGESLQNSDRITTGAGGFVLVGIADEVNFRIGENSEVLLSAIIESSGREISLENGSILSGISRLKRSQQYRVNTPNAVAAVRGTEFMTSYSEGQTVVAVGRGSVLTMNPETKEELLVSAERAAVVTETIEEREVSKEEILELKRLEVLSSSSKENFEAGILDSEELINSEINKLKSSQGMPLKEIRQRHGRIDVITMYSGLEIRGAILSRGEKLRVLTPAGIVNLPANEVRSTEVIR